MSRPDATPADIKALEMDVTGKIMLASWRGTRFEVVQVLRAVRPFVTCFTKTYQTVAVQVAENVLKEHGVSEAVLLNRAKVCSFSQPSVYSANGYDRA